MKRIGIYAGSFNPFHAGHKNVLDKAKYLFDEVIVAMGINPAKIKLTDALTPNPDIDRRLFDLKVAIPNESVDYYTCFLPDYVKRHLTPDTHVTVIRGLRDGYDLDYETKMIRYMQDMMPEISVIEILCDKEFSHISSSGIREIASLENFTGLHQGIKYSEKYLQY